MVLQGDVTIHAASNEGLDFKILIRSCAPGERHGNRLLSHAISG